MQGVVGKNARAGPIAGCHWATSRARVAFIRSPKKATPTAVLPEPLKPLALVDPQLAATVADNLRHRPQPVGRLAAMVADILWALAIEESFGRAVAEGLSRLTAGEPAELVATYTQTIHQAAARGPTLGRFYAVYLVPVLQAGLVAPFNAAVEVMLAKGPYTLEGPFDILADLIHPLQHQEARAYLELLRATFAKDLPYGRCRHFGSALPRAVAAMPQSRRTGQIQQVTRMMVVDPDLADAFIKGLDQGLGRLDDTALARFGDRAIAVFHHDPQAGRRFAALASGAGLKALQDLQTAADLTSQRLALTRYVQARTGLPLTLRPLSDLGPALVRDLGPATLAVTDGSAIYLPEQIAIGDCAQVNARYYRILAAMEAATLEFGTFGFDLPKARDLIAAKGLRLPGTPAADPGAGSDLMRFWAHFPDPALAADLFAVCEHGRLHALVQAAYPGLMRQARPLLLERFAAATGPSVGPLAALYGKVALQRPVGPGPWRNTVDAIAGTITQTFRQCLDATGDIAVETGALLTLAGYGPMAALAGTGPVRKGRLVQHLSGRGLRPDLFERANRKHLDQARALQAALLHAGIAVNGWPLVRHLIANQGLISAADISGMVGPGQALSQRPAAWRHLLTAGSAAMDRGPAADDETAAFWYPEWDVATGDYLQRYCRVLEKPVAGGDPAFYGQFLTDHRGLVKQVRRAFERIKPAALQWQRRRVEGEIFDVGALVDFCVDRRAGRMPSDRLYNRRSHARRNVAALLLLDISHSTAQIPDGGYRPVLSVAKEALVLFGEALAVLGDSLAIAGFCSSGRLGIGYHCIKAFGDPLDATIWGRISGLTAQGATRMGGAIRHATARLLSWPAALRLLIVISDGFPNDADYKKAYAAADTRQALAEARGHHIFTHGITVKPLAAPVLDDLYGTLHHTVIADVGDLADRLLRVYAKLTRT